LSKNINTTEQVILARKVHSAQLQEAFAGRSSLSELFGAILLQPAQQSYIIGGKQVMSGLSQRREK